MDSHVWREVYQMIRLADRKVPRFGRKMKYDDVLIVAMYVWSVAHDRPMSWACDRSHYTSFFRPRVLPSVSQFSRRVRRERFERMLQYIHNELADVQRRTGLSFLDGRALCVGAHTKDRDAARGRASGGMGKGYKLHVCAEKDGRIPVWSIEPLNVDEKTVAGELLRTRPPWGLVLADGNYDAGWLFDMVNEAGASLIVPPPDGVGGGHRPQSDARLASAAHWPGLGKYMYKERLTVERIFGAHASAGDGLHALPAWVRTLPRVRRWVGTKLVLYHAKLRNRANAA